jgi:hypothetical protein
MKQYTVTQEQMLTLVEHLAILQESEIHKSKFKEIMHTTNLVLEILGLDEIFNEELDYLEESKLK